MQNIGDLVWAKVRYSPHWPAIVVEKPIDLRIPKNNIFVRFFGTENFGIIDPKNIHDFHMYRNKYERKKKTKDMLNALQCIDEYSSNTLAIDHTRTTQIEGEISLIQELGDSIKLERDMDLEPYDTIQVNVNNYDPRDREISTLKAEKAQMVIDLVNLKSQNNDLYLKGQEILRKQNLLTNDIRTIRQQNQLFEKQTSDQRKVINELKDSNKTLASLVTELQTHIKKFTNGQALLPSSNELNAEKEESEEVNANVTLTNTSQVKVESNAEQGGNQENPPAKRKARSKALKETKTKTEKKQLKPNLIPIDKTYLEVKELEEKDIPASVKKPFAKRKANDKGPSEPEKKKTKNEVKENNRLFDQVEFEAQNMRGKNERAIENPKVDKKRRGKEPKETKTKTEKKELQSDIGPFDNLDSKAQELKGKDKPEAKKPVGKRSYRKKNST